MLPAKVQMLLAKVQMPPPQPLLILLPLLPAQLVLHLPQRPPPQPGLDTPPIDCVRSPHKYFLHGSPGFPVSTILSIDYIWGGGGGAEKVMRKVLFSFPYFLNPCGFTNQAKRQHQRNQKFWVSHLPVVSAWLLKFWNLIGKIHH